MKLLLSVFLLFCMLASYAQNDMNIVYIGNSITQGVILKDSHLNSPSAKCSENIRKHLPSLNHSNTGLSGTTTLDYLPSLSTYFKRITDGADSLREKPIIFSVMIGTNDSAERGPNGSPVSVENYKNNLKTILDTLLTRYKNSVAVIHRPIYYSENTYNSSEYLTKGLNRLKSYTISIEQLVDESNGRIFLGDTLAFSYFEKNHTKMCFAEKGAAGTFYLHPNAKGAKKLGKFWSDAILRVVKCLE